MKCTESKIGLSSGVAFHDNRSENATFWGVNSIPTLTKGWLNFEPVRYSAEN